MEVNRMSETNGPLQGLVVIECATVVAAPLIGRILADFGAEVIHVEHPLKGDHLRQFGFSVEGINPWWKYYGRNKKNITLDISKEKGRQVLFGLLEKADVFIENFRPGRLEEWNIHYDDLKKINEKLIMVRVTGFGQDGPYRNQPGFGTLIEAMSGFAALVGDAEGPPTLPPFPLADSFAGLFGLFALMFAIYYRDVVGSGKGQVIDVSIWEGLYSMVGPNAAIYDLTGKILERVGNRAFTSAPRNCYQTKDNRWVAIAGATQTTAARFFKAIGNPELINDPRFNTNENRIKNVEALDAIVGKWFKMNTLSDILEVLKTNEVPVGPVMDIRDIIKDPHAKHRQMIIDFPDDDKDVLMMEGIFPKMSLTPGVVKHTGKKMGADNKEILEKFLGLSKEDIKDLSVSRII